MAALPEAVPPAAEAWPRRTRLDLHEELHARPALAVRRPGVVSYWVQWAMEPAVAEAALRQACVACGAGAPEPGARHHVLQVPGFSLKYERHGEFVSWQVNCGLAEGSAGPWDDEKLAATLRRARALDALPAGFAASLREPGGGEMLAATHVVILQCEDEGLLPRTRAVLARELAGGSGPRDDSSPLLGSWIADDKAAVLTDLRLQDDGFTRLVLLDFGLAPDQAAREAQRLCELEAYRMLAMLGFPLAQRESQGLAELESTLQQTVDEMAADDGHDGHDAQQAFDRLTRLAAEVEHSAARTRYRFSATRAYHQVVQRRLSDLREKRLEGLQTLSGFLARRFSPAIAFCESTDARLTDVADRINRAVNLARVRMERHREASNQELFKALAHRQALQLRLQQTVEGLSVVAISYYLLGLVGYLAKAAKTVPGWESLHVQPDLVVGLSVVPVVIGVKVFLGRLHRHLGTG